MTVLMIERVTEGESGGQQRGSAISRVVPVAPVSV